MMRVMTEVEVDFADLEDIDTDDLVRELADRWREVVLDAIIMLKTGRIDDGIVTLEREFFPRYADVAECKAAYLRARLSNPPEKMGGVDDYITKALGLTIAATDEREAA